MAILLLSIPVYFLAINYFHDYTIGWLLEGTQQFSLAFTLNFDEIESIQIFNKNISDYTPQNLLFGDAQYLFNNEASNKQNDTGYINYFFFGGVLYSFLLYGTFAWFYIKVLLESKTIKIKGVILSTLIMYFVANSKGMIFYDCELTRGFFLLLVFVLFDVKQLNQYKKFHSG